MPPPQRCQFSLLDLFRWTRRLALLLVVVPIVWKVCQIPGVFAVLWVTAMVVGLSHSYYLQRYVWWQCPFCLQTVQTGEDKCERCGQQRLGRQSPSE